jgi:4-amino-4-deoxy-L-arabinose transferase-like glycosyltransferase
MNFLSQQRYFYVFLLFCALFLIFPISFTHLFDWDEINFAESSREMLVTGNYLKVQINFEPFIEKPPLFFWLQALSMKMMGVNEYAARFPNALFGLLTILLIYLIGKKEQNQKFGLIWSIVYMGSYLPFLYYKSGIIDPIFNFFIFSSVYFLFKSINETTSKNLYYAMISGALIGLGIITKGPVAILIVILTYFFYILINRFEQVGNWKSAVVFIFSALITSMFWYGYETFQNGPSFIINFLKYQIDLFLHPVAGHQQPFYYHFAVILFGCFPMSIYAIPYLFKRNNHEKFTSLMLVLFWIILILFSITTTKIVHYSSLCYLPLSYLASHYIVNYPLRKFQKWMLFSFTILFNMLFATIPFVILFIEHFNPLIKDEFVRASISIVKDINPTIPITLVVVYFILSITIITYIFKKNELKSILSLGILNIVFLSFYLYLMVPEIEKFSQRPAIEFFKELKGQDVYVNVLGYKSYAHYFYFEQPILTAEQKNIDWQLRGKIDKPAYFVTKVNKINEYQHYRTQRS